MDKQKRNRKIYELSKVGFSSFEIAKFYDLSRATVLSAIRTQREKERREETRRLKEAQELKKENYTPRRIELILAYHVGYEDALSGRTADSSKVTE